MLPLVTLTWQARQFIALMRDLVGRSCEALRDGILRQHLRLTPGLGALPNAARSSSRSRSNLMAFMSCNCSRSLNAASGSRNARSHPAQDFKVLSGDAALPGISVQRTRDPPPVLFELRHFR